MTNAIRRLASCSLLPDHFTFADGSYVAKLSMAGVPPEQIDLRYHLNYGEKYLTVGGEFWTILPPDADPETISAEAYHGMLVVTAKTTAGRKIEVRPRERAA